MHQQLILLFRLFFSFLRGYFTQFRFYIKYNGMFDHLQITFISFAVQNIYIYTDNVLNKRPTGLMVT